MVDEEHHWDYKAPSNDNLQELWSIKVQWVRILHHFVQGLWIAVLWPLVFKV